MVGVPFWQCGAQWRSDGDGCVPARVRLPCACNGLWLFKLGRKHQHAQWEGCEEWVIVRRCGRGIKVTSLVKAYCILPMT